MVMTLAAVLCVVAIGVIHSLPALMHSSRLGRDFLGFIVVSSLLRRASAYKWHLSLRHILPSEVQSLLLRSLILPTEGGSKECLNRFLDTPLRQSQQNPRIPRKRTSRVCTEWSRVWRAMKSAVICCLYDVARRSSFEYPDGRPASASNLVET